MHDPWLLVEPGELEDGRVVALDRGESRHAAGALRLEEGAAVVLADGCGRLAEGTLRAVSGRRTEVAVGALRVASPPAGEGVTLALGVLAGQAMDWAVQKAVEVGVQTLVPVRSERSQLGLRAIRGRLEHWRRVARQALKQCRRPWAMEIREAIALTGLVAERGTSGGVVAARDGVAAQMLGRPVPPMLLVGPEGGFSVAEDRLLDPTSWRRLRLGRHVLRAETAAVVGSAIMVARFDGDT
jgi:16S rRNA (uracil1498-N3)-methyltransferase